MKSDLHVYLLNHKKRLTPSKELVFELLNNHQAITINELYSKVSKQMDRATMYRILQQFYELKVIKDVVINGVRKIELADYFNSHHHHLICGRCGNVVNINDMKLEQYLKRLALVNKFVHVSHSFEIVGLCPTCRPQPTADLPWAGVE